MAKQIEEGELALYKYNKIRYSFVSLDAGDQQILTSDPWSFLSSDLQLRLNNTRGNNRKKIERAMYYAGLAEDFYKAAGVSPLPAKGALLYYGMLDLVKCFLSLNDVPLESTHEHHGLVLPVAKEQTVEVKGKMREAVNIFYEFTRLLGKPVRLVHEVRLEQAMSHIPEVHSIYTSLGHRSKRKLLPVDIEFQVNKARDKLFTEVIYQKEQEAKVEVDKFLKGERKKYFKEGYPRDKKVVFRAAKRKSFSQENIHRIYKNILADYQKLDIVPILTNKGYRYYVDLRPGDLPQLSYSLLAMFYLGSAARYRPSEIKSLFEGALRPLVSEFVSLAPKQFLYQMVSITTKNECVIPFAAI
ncbi:uncharacterized protein HMF8227_00315 [Saliniradius amylolyticus]|uniref:Uncharacterized protein n=1 Tax=Saliniradius amylolyticus TaxID=2183582 RepID=A0A2S2DZK3_9ALTE|nr:YaaC family protein [Saliniradius amylolyticus]AWL10821.1 uncharacterized protein HMF8227_00315 [Saliniradius amylolyticus]